MRPAFGALVSMTLRQPAKALAVLRGLGLTMEQRWAALALTTSLSTLLAGVAGLLFPVPEGGGPLIDLAASPFVLAVLQFVALTIAAWLTATIGRMFGGQGSFPDALLALTWVDLIVTMAQAAQLVLMLVSPGFAALLSIPALALYVYLIVRMTTVLHGFANPLMVALTLFATLMLIGAALSILLTMLGVMPAPVEAS